MTVRRLTGRCPAGPKGRGGAIGSRGGCPRLTSSPRFRTLLETTELEFEDEPSVEEAICVWKDSAADFADCLIGARHRALGCRGTATFDVRALKMPGFTMRTIIMTVMTDLVASLSQAIALASRLRSMSEGMKEGEFKRIIDALLVELAEVQLKLEELVSENATLKVQPQTHANPQQEMCPRCGEFGWRLSSSRPHKTPGVVVQTYTCPKCKLKEETLIRPK